MKEYNKFSISYSALAIGFEDKEIVEFSRKLLGKKSRELLKEFMGINFIPIHAIGY
ncbi:hypothetical protein [Caldanaerobacter subterraneus]|uniref:Uncharacterized protein n=1 Tax=Caldanaerobacter subterraneus TaxID=911092 RepID=A0A7Y2PLD4_9THEO|nr:hypothetical protein [Caldanaerobacter subterraneus]NNG67959.1 hypothetical protein [Caldanaerobacter subterraneus]